MIKPIQITTGDTVPWKFTVKDETGAAVDLTSATVVFYMRKRGSTTNKINGSSVTVTSASGGVLTYSPTTNDVNTAGTYDAEIWITDSNGKVQKPFEFIPIRIRESLA